MHHLGIPVLLLIFVLFCPGIFASEQENCDVMGIALARNFCMPCPEKTGNIAQKPTPDPISVGGFSGMSCRFALWVEKLTFQLASLCLAEETVVEKKVGEENTPQLAAPVVQRIDITVGNRNIICVPIEIETE